MPTSTSVLFKGGAILFKDQSMSFCPDDCTCVEQPPPPPPPPGCPACESASSCFLLSCSPSTVSVSFSGVTIPASVACTNGGGTVTLTGGPLVGPNTLTQDPANPCRWLLDNPSSPLTATGPGGLTTSRLWLQVERVDAGFVVHALMLFPGWIGFSIFGGGTTAIKAFPDSGTFTVPGSTDPAYCLSCTFGGGRLGTGGTATVSTCPSAPPVPCSLTDGGCLVVGVGDLTACNLFTPFSGEGGTLASVLLKHVSAGHWASDPGNYAGVTNAAFALVYLDGSDPAAAPYGCGYYLTVTGSSTAGVYYLRSTVPSGTYTAQSTKCDGLPATLTVAVADCPVTPPCDAAACGDPSAWPSSVSVTIVDPDHDSTDPLYAGGTHTLLLSGTTYEAVLDNGVMITLTCGGAGWLATILPPSGPDTTLTGTCPPGSPTQLTACPTDCSTGCSTIDFSVSWEDPPDSGTVTGTLTRSGCDWLGGTSHTLSSITCYVDGTDGKAYWQAYFTETSGADCNIYWRCPVYGPYPEGPWVPDPTTDPTPCIAGTLTTSSCGPSFGGAGSGSPATGTYTYLPSLTGSEWKNVSFTLT